MSRRLPILLCLLLACAAPSIASPVNTDCVLGDESRQGLERWKSIGFEVPDGFDRSARATALATCLADADPFLRDDIAFSALSTWMRKGHLDHDSLLRLEQQLLAALEGDDADGFGKPFAALALAEIARTDRAQPWMTPDQRARMVDAAAGYLRSVRDYRGYVDGEGWRHGVAHGADWAMQLVLNKALQPAQAMTLVSAAGAQVMAADGHAYGFGEPGRLARPVAYAAARGDLDDAQLGAWLDGLVVALGPQPAGPVQADWWARRSNLEQFLNALAYLVAGEQAPGLVSLAASIETTLARLP